MLEIDLPQSRQARGRPRITIFPVATFVGQRMLVKPMATATFCAPPQAGDRDHLIPECVERSGCHQKKGGSDEKAFVGHVGFHGSTMKSRGGAEAIPVRSRPPPQSARLRPWERWCRERRAPALTLINEPRLPGDPTSWSRPWGRECAVRH